MNLITGWQGDPPQCELADPVERSGYLLMESGIS